MIKLIKNTFYKEKETKRKVCDFIKSSKVLSFGKQCEKFEKDFAKYQGRKHATMVNSGSSANLAILQALLNLGKIKKGDNIGFSALTWATNVMPIIQLGLKPIPIDVEIETLNVSSSILKKSLLDNKIKVLFLTNLLGFCGDIDNIQNVCFENDITLLEDNCESLGSIYKGKKLGNFGLASSFSFYVGHHLSTIEGGMICTDDDNLANMLKMVRAHGWDRNLSKPQQDKIRERFSCDDFYGKYTFYDLGYNFRPTEINGFIGQIQLGFAKEIFKSRNRNFLLVNKAMNGSDKFINIRHEHMEFVSNFAIPVICKNEKIKNEMVKKCKGKVEIRPIVGGSIINQPFYKKYNQNEPLTFAPNADFVNNNGFYIGNNPEMTTKEIEVIIKKLS